MIPTTAVRLSCTIQGNSVSIIAGSFSCTYTLNNRPTGSFRVYYTGSTPPGDEGDEVVIARQTDAGKIFAGRITSVSVNTDEVGVKFASISISGYEVLADRRIVAEVYFNRSAGYIVNDIITKYLSADGVTAGVIDTGDVIADARFGYEPASTVLRKLAEANGYIWFIDRDQALHFIERDTTVAPYAIDESMVGNKQIRSLRLDKSLTQYRNRQYLRYNELTSLRTERFAGDGETKTWSVEFPIATKPDITVNGIAQTVGIAGLDPEGSFDFFWSKGTQSIGQDVLVNALSGLSVDLVDTLLPFGSITAPLTLISGVHAWNDYLVVSFSDTNGGYVLYKRNGTQWEQVNNLNVFTGRQAIRIIGMGSYFVAYESYGIDSVDVNVYQIIGDTLSFIATAETSTLGFVQYYTSALGRHIAQNLTNTIPRSIRVRVVADDGTTTNATNTDDDVGTDNRFFLGYQDGYAFIYDNSVVSYSGGTLRQLAITANDYAITSDPTNLTGEFITFASTDTYAFFQTSAGIEWYKRTGASATLSKLTTLTPPTGYTFASKIAVYDDWLIIAVNETPYLISYRIDRSNDTLVYSGAYTSGLTDDPDIIVSYSGGFIAAKTTTTQIIGAYTGGVSITTPPDVLEVEYVGTFPNVTVVNDFAEITARIAVEGGTGLYEAYQNATDTDSEPSAIDIAQAILERYGRIPKVVSFETRLQGFEDGQIITINWPSLGISNEDYLIERIGIRDESATALWYQLRCISGRDIGNWQEFWRSLRPSDSFDFGGSDTLPRVAAVNDTINIGDTVTAISAATQTNWDEGNWEEMEWQLRA